MTIHLRPVAAGDLDALAKIYREAVIAIGPQAYDAEQVRVWALYPDSMDEFRERLSRGFTLVAEAGANGPVAFGQLDPEDHVAFLYCAPSSTRRGIASAIYQRLEAHAMAQGQPELTTDASRISRPFFAKHGFEVTAVEHAVRLGVEFERFRMHKALRSSVGRPGQPA